MPSSHSKLLRNNTDKQDNATATSAQDASFQDTSFGNLSMSALENNASSSQSGPVLHFNIPYDGQHQANAQQTQNGSLPNTLPQLDYGLAAGQASGVNTMSSSSLMNFFPNSSYSQQNLAFSPTQSQIADFGIQGVSGSQTGTITQGSNLQFKQHAIAQSQPESFIIPIASSSQAQSSDIAKLLSPGEGALSLHLSEAHKGQPQTFTRVSLQVSFTILYLVSSLTDRRYSPLKSPLALLAAAGAADSKAGDSIESPSVQSLRQYLGIQVPFHQTPQQHFIRPGSRSLVGGQVTHTSYFSDINPTCWLDYDEVDDPVTKCLITEEEARKLLDTFWRYLQPLVSVSVFVKFGCLLR